MLRLAVASFPPLRVAASILCEKRHFSAVFAQHPCLKYSHRMVLGSTPSGTSFCLMEMPFVRSRNSSASFAAFRAARAVALPSSVVGSFMSFSRCAMIWSFVFKPSFLPKLMSLFASFFNL